jgi:hypothetical protein
MKWLAPNNDLPKVSLLLRGLWALAIVALPSLSLGQGTIMIGFDGPPRIPPGSGVLVQSYSEAGMSFTPINPNSQGFGRVYETNANAPDPYNGTVYLQAPQGSTLRFSFAGGSSLFGLISAEVAGYSTVVPAFSIPFIGYRPDGSTVQTNFSGGGINFRAVYFGPEFSGLSRVEIPTYAWSLDNLVVSIPEPNTGALLTTGVLALTLRRLKSPRRARAVARYCIPLGGCALVSSGVAQGTLAITFDGPPIIPRGSGIVVQSYYESGFYFSGLPSSDGFTRQGGGSPLIPDNGTAYVQAGAGDSLVFSNLNGNVFSLQAVDLAAFSTAAPNFSVPFVGYRANGSIVATNFSGSGINFRTVHFGPDFSGLSRVEIPAYAWSLDNLVVSIPEPSQELLVVGCCLAGLVLRRRGHS